VVPRVRPENQASAIWQKKMLPPTSVNGSVTIAPLQVPLSAGRRLDVSNKTMIVKDMITAERNFSFIGFLQSVTGLAKSRRLVRTAVSKDKRFHSSTGSWPTNLEYETYRRVPALNCSPAFINTLADLVCDAIGA